MKAPCRTACRRARVSSTVTPRRSRTCANSFKRSAHQGARIVKTIIARVSVGKVTAGARVAFRTGSAGASQRHALEDGSSVHRVRPDDVAEIVVAHVQVDSGHPFTADPQAVQPFELAVRFHEHVPRWVVAETFDSALPAQDNARDIPQVADAYVDRAVEPPIVKNRDQKISAWCRTKATANGCDGVMREVWNQIHDGVAAKRRQLTMNRERICTKWDHTEDAVRYVRGLQPAEPAHHMVIRAAALVVHSDSVVDLPGAVYADADPDITFAEDLRPIVIEKCRICLNGEIGRHDVLEHLAGPLAPPVKLCDTDQARLATVKQDLHPLLATPQAMPSNSLERRLEDLIRHESRAVFPQRITFIVDITIRAIQITSRCYLEHNLINTRG